MFMTAMVKIFSFGERWIFPWNVDRFRRYAHMRVQAVNGVVSIN